MSWTPGEGSVSGRKEMELTSQELVATPTLARALLMEVEGMRPQGNALEGLETSTHSSFREFCINWSREMAGSWRGVWSLASRESAFILAKYWRYFGMFQVVSLLVCETLCGQERSPLC